VTKIVKKFDDNGDGVFQMDEFRSMLQNLEPEIDDKKIMSLFKQSIGVAENGVLNDAVNEDVLYMTFS
jgi:Ca2+-binding EF-hand superfamily protein